MAKIRADLIGVVQVREHLLAPGDEVPEGIELDPSLLDAPSTSEKAPQDEDDDLGDLLGDSDEKKAPAKRAPRAKA